MENFNTPIKYYNLTGKYTKSEKEFKKYMRKELLFYENLHNQALKNGVYGTKIKFSKINSSLD